MKGRIKTRIPVLAAAVALLAVASLPHALATTPTAPTTMSPRCENPPVPGRKSGQVEIRHANAPAFLAAGATANFQG